MSTDNGPRPEPRTERAIVREPDGTWKDHDDDAVFIEAEAAQGAAPRAEGLTLEVVKRAIRYVTDNEPYDLSLVKECARLANDVIDHLRAGATGEGERHE